MYKPYIIDALEIVLHHDLPLHTTLLNQARLLAGETPVFQRHITSS